MMIVLLIFLFSIIGSIGAIITAAIFLTFKNQIQKTLIPCLISYAIGTLLTAALLGMIPNAISRSNPTLIMFFILGGIIFFFLLEKTIIWHHCHNENCNLKSAAGPILLIGDTFHNFMDGIVIAASFLISINMGIIVSLSVIAHEIPQEIGDFAILLDSGYSKKKALFLNALSSSSTIPAALISYYLLDTINSLIPIFLAISAASFIYIALTDLAPNLHRKLEVTHSIRQILLIIAGICTIIVILLLKP
jgi:zinc and cadmium transporter